MESLELNFSVRFDPTEGATVTTEQGEELSSRDTSKVLRAFAEAETHRRQLESYVKQIHGHLHEYDLGDREDDQE